MLADGKWSPIGRTFGVSVTSIQIFEVKRNGFGIWYAAPELRLSLFSGKCRIGTLSLKQSDFLPEMQAEKMFESGRYKKTGNDCVSSACKRNVPNTPGSPC